MSRDLERGWIRMEWSCLYRVGVNLDRVYWIPALSRGYFEPQNIECRSNHYILLRFLVLLFDIVLRTPHPAGGSPVSTFKRERGTPMFSTRFPPPALVF